MGMYGYYLEPHIPMWRTGVATVFGFQDHGKEIGHGFLLCFVDKITDKIEITGLYLVNSFQHSKSEKHVRWRDTGRTTHVQAMYFPDWTGLDITKII